MVRLGLLFVSAISSAVLWVGEAGADIRIGMAGPLTGSLAWIGEQLERGAARRRPWPSSTPRVACSGSRSS